MVNVILAAGYATRLYPLTENFPKPLLPVGGVTILDRLLNDLDAVPEVTRHIVVTNHRFFPQFEAWKASASHRTPVELLDDGSVSNETRLGAVRDLLAAVEAFGLQHDDVMAMAADNVLDFPLQGFVRFFLEKQTSVVMCHHEPSVEALRRTGVVCLDEDDRVTLMEEKPQQPLTHWAVPPFYIYAASDMPLISGAMAHGCGFDAPGNLAHYVADHSVLHAWKMPGHRYDIGDLPHYRAVDELFSQNQNKEL